MSHASDHAVQRSSRPRPNPWKVAFVLSELEVPYEFRWVKYLDCRKEPYLSINPDGKVPALYDPNTDVTVFESGACIEYIIETYDGAHKLGYEDAARKWQLRSWLFFQCCGQGPFFGQNTWFSRFHQEKDLASAIERYAHEAKRIMGVVEATLSKQQELHREVNNGPWLVGDKHTYADLAFVSWNNLLEFMFPELDQTGWIKDEFSLYWGWWQRMLALPSVKQVLEQKAEFNSTLEDSADEARHAR